MIYVQFLFFFNNWWASNRLVDATKLGHTSRLTLKSTQTGQTSGQVWKHFLVPTLQTGSQALLSATPHTVYSRVKPNLPYEETVANTETASDLTQASSECLHCSMIQSMWVFWALIHTVSVQRQSWFPGSEVKKQLLTSGQSWVNLNWKHTEMSRLHVGSAPPIYFNM